MMHRSRPDKLQVRPAGLTKGNMASKIISIIQSQHQQIGFVLCMGDFLTRDDDVFQYLTSNRDNTEVFVSQIMHFFRAHLT
jgi:trehalose-6-phosphatase